MAKSWPTPQDYNEAIQSPHICFSDEDLRHSSVELNAMGLPRSASGTFASVYRVKNTTVSWAVRCFLSQREGQRERYKHISDFILFDNLDSTVDFHYLEEGIKVRNEWYPCLKMSWIEGDTLDQYVDKYHEDPEKIRNLLSEFHKLVGELEGAGIGHGDLQHGNIIVSPKGLRLVDYDALFVPALSGLKSLEFGHPNYQHPHRTEDHYDHDVDNFSCWLIHTSLLAIAVEPSLYRELGGGDDCLLFKRKDLVSPETSRVFETLLNHPSKQVKETAHLLLRMLWAAPNTIPYLGAPWEQLNELPQEKPSPQAVLALTGTEHIPAGLDIESRIKEANRVSDLQSIYEVIDASTTARKAARRRKSPFNKAYETTFAAGVKTRDRIAQLADDLERTTAPFAWINRKMRDARKFFFDADYDASIKLLLDVYREVETHARGEVNLDVLTWLGYSYAMNGNPSLAGNYFLLALKAAKQTGEFTYVQHAALVLAISRYEAGNEALALKVLEDNRSSLAGLSELLKQEIGNIYLARPTSYQVLHIYGNQLLMANDSDTLAHELLDCATIVFNEMVRCASCDEKTLDSYMNLCTSLYRARLIPECKTAFMHLTGACKILGFVKHGRVARFCAAVVLIGAESGEENALDLLSEFGKMSVAELVELASESKTFVSQAAIAKLLLHLYTTFDGMDWTGEAKEALRAACIFATTCRAVVDDQIIGALNNVDKETIEDCLQESYLKDDHKEAADLLISKLIEKRSIKTLSVVMGQLAKLERTEQVASLCYYLAKKEELNTLRSLVQSADYYYGASSDGSPLATLTGGLNSAVEQAFERIEKLETALFSSDHTPMNTLAQATSEVDLTNAYKSFLKEIGDADGARAITNRLVSGRYDRVMQAWTTAISEKGPFQKLAEMALDLAMLGLSAPLKRIFHSLVRQKLWSAIELVGQHLRSSGQLQALLELAEELAEDGNFETFKWIASEITGRAESAAIIELTDCLVDRLPYGTAQEYVSTIIKQLLHSHRILILSLLLNHMYDRQILFMIEPAAEEFIGTSYGASIFSELLARGGLPTIGQLVRSIACLPPDHGLSAFTEMLRTGGVSDTTITNIYDATFDEGIRSLEKMSRLIDDPERLLKEQSDNNGSVGLMIELKLVMKALLNLCDFLITEPALATKLEDWISASFDQRYDKLAVLWATALAEDDAIDEIARISVALAQRAPDRLDQLVMRLAAVGKQNALKRIAEELIEKKDPQTSLSVAYSLVRSRDYDNFRAVSLQIILNCEDTHLLAQFISNTAQLNNRLADLIVRQIGRSGRTKLLDSICMELAEMRDLEALPMVLDELLAAGRLDLSADIATIGDAVGYKGINVLAKWLLNLGLDQYIKARADNLLSAGRDTDADAWNAWLEQD